MGHGPVALAAPLIIRSDVPFSRLVAKPLIPLFCATDRCEQAVRLKSAKRSTGLQLRLKPANIWLAPQAGRKTVRTHKTKEIAMSTTIPSVGYIITWDIYHNRKPRADLVNAMAQCGYPQEIINAVPDFDQAAEVRKAGARWTSGRGRKQDKYFTKSPVYEDDHCIDIGILKEIRKDDHTVDREQVDRIRFLKATSTWDHGHGITSQSIALKRHIEKALLEHHP